MLAFINLGTTEVVFILAAIAVLLIVALRGFVKNRA